LVHTGKLACVYAASIKFFATASGAMTVTVPRFRLRLTVPVSHQPRSLLQRRPASCSTQQMVGEAAAVSDGEEGFGAGEVRGRCSV
jgi:hypothetical protein